MSDDEGPFDQALIDALWAAFMGERTCQLCGGPLQSHSKYGICSFNAECRKAAAYAKQVAYRASPKGKATIAAHNSIPPSVYLVHFPSAGIVKLGHATNRRYENSARERGRKRFGATDGRSIWLRPDDEDQYYERNMQARFRYKMIKNNGRTASEWFKVGDVTAEKLIAQLDDTYDQIPEQPR